MDSTPAEKARSPVFRLSFYAIAFASVLTWFASPALAFDYDGASMSAVRDRTDPRRLSVTVSLKGVNPTDRQNLGITTDDAQVVQQAIVNHLDICLSKTSATCGSADTKVRWAIQRLPNPQVENDYLSQTQIANFDSNGTILTNDTSDLNLWNYSIRIIITDSANNIDVGTKVLLRMFPDRESSNGNKDKTDLLVSLGAGVRDAVGVTRVLGTPKSLTVLMTASPTVTFMNDTKGQPTGVVGLLIPKPDNSTTIPLLNYQENPDAAPITTSCPLSVAEDQKSCSIECPGEAVPRTINLSEAASLGIRSNTNNKLSDGNLGFVDVSIEEGPYAIILQYLPEGTGLSCVMGSPTDAGTLVQLSGGSEPTTGDPNCFIATAAYGTAMDSRIDVLRWFRDAYLIPNPIGKEFVRFYIRNAPTVAAWISDREWARSLTRGALWLPVVTLEAFKNQELFTLSFVALFAALGAFGSFLFLQRRRLSR